MVLLSEFENSGLKVSGRNSMSHCVLQEYQICFALQKIESHIAVMFFLVLFVLFSATGECETEG